MSVSKCACKRMSKRQQEREQARERARERASERESERESKRERERERGATDPSTEGITFLSSGHLATAQSSPGKAAAAAIDYSCCVLTFYA